MSQTIRGTVLDKNAQFPLIGVTVALIGSEEGTITDVNDHFKLEQIPLGPFLTV